MVLTRRAGCAALRCAVLRCMCARQMMVMHDDQYYDYQQQA
jgi:hypothetical protein